MAITKDDTHHINEQGDILPHPDIDLTGTEHTCTGTGYIMPDITFTPQQKAFIMSLFGIEMPFASTSTPPVTPAPVTPTFIQTKVQATMNDPLHLSREIIRITWSTTPSQRSIKNLLYPTNSTFCGLTDTMAPLIPTNISNISWL